MTTPADVEAARDVINDITEASDSTDFETAVELMDVLEKLRAEAGEAVDLLKMQILRRLEEGGPRVYGDRTFVPVNDNVQRFDHDEVLRRAMNDSLVDDNGEIRSAGVALEIMADWVKNLYLAPSTKAKVEAIDKLGLERDLIITKHKKGRKVFIVDNREPQ